MSRRNPKRAPSLVWILTLGGSAAKGYNRPRRGQRTLSPKPGTTKRPFWQQNKPFGHSNSLLLMRLRSCSVLLLDVAIRSAVLLAKARHSVLHRSSFCSLCRADNDGVTISEWASVSQQVAQLAHRYTTSWQDIPQFEMPFVVIQTCQTTPTLRLTNEI